MRRLFLTAGLVLSVGFAATSASASVLYPGPFVGSTVTYTQVVESSADPINDPDPLFGAPTITTGNLLDFDPSANPFAASSPPADTTDGSLTFIVTSNDGSPIPGLVISESGDFSLFGFPNSALSGFEGVLSVLAVTVRDLDNPSNPDIQASSTFIELFDNPPFEGVFWDNEVSIDLSSLGTTQIEVELDNILQAVSDPGSPVTTLIRKKDFQVDVVPEPSSGLLIALGAGLMAIRRRKG